jgi:vacuolar-type H+-ATPase subunit H
MQDTIKELAAAIESATRLPMGGKLLMDEGFLRRIVDQLRRAAPDQQQLWEQIVAERERVLNAAEDDARRMREDAQYGNLDEQAVVQAARQRAREIIAEADLAAAKLREEADRYVLNQFNFLEQRLMRVLREVQAGQRSLGTGE